jgi:hypothetical protein
MNLIEVMNEYGYEQWVDEEGHATCPMCKSLMMPNRGEG